MTLDGSDEGSAKVTASLEAMVDSGDRQSRKAGDTNARLRILESLVVKDLVDQGESLTVVTLRSYTAPARDVLTSSHHVIDAGKFSVCTRPASAVLRLYTP